MRKNLCWLLVIAALVPGCATDPESTYVKDGVTHQLTGTAFRGRWWSYYERGLALQALDALDRAEADFKKALSGRSTDSWRARTYGLHFGEYFPTRELGITYFKAGRLDEAEQALTKALEQVDTERAHYYLDRVKKAKVAQGLIPDDNNPQLSTGLVSGSYVAERSVQFDINASDDAGVFCVAVNGREFYQRGSQKAITFSEATVLDEGVHEFEIAATDLADKITTEKMTINVDLTGPTIGLYAPVESIISEDTAIVLQGAAADLNGVMEVALDGKVIVQANAEKRVEFAADLPLQPGENSFMITARDVAGNENRALVRVFQGQRDNPQAQLWLINEKRPDLLKTASLATMPLALLFQTAEAPASGVVIRSPKADVPYRHNKAVRVYAEVLSPTKLTDIKVNDLELTPLTGAPKEVIDKRLPVEGEGPFDVTVLATDEAGATYSAEVSVEIRPVELGAEFNMGLAVHPAEGSGTDMDGFRAQLEQTVGEMGRFKMLERTQLEAILQEQQLSVNLGDQASLIQLGKLALANGLLASTITEKDNNGLEIRVRVIDTTTGEIAKWLDTFVDDKTQSGALQKACEALASQLETFYPKLSGELLLANASGLRFNWTEEDGVHGGMYVFLTQEIPAEIDPDLGIPLSEASFVPVGRARITKVDGVSSQAEQVDFNGEKIPLERGMPAITM